MVASQEKLASKIGLTILKEGGNAIDAAVAMGFALAVTLPQAGNLGGGGFMIIHLATENRTIAIDFRETAPANATTNMFIDKNGNVDNYLARFSTKSSGTPGSVHGLLSALNNYGTMSRTDVITPAFNLAKKGFRVSQQLHTSLKQAKQRLAKDDYTFRIFTPMEKTPAVGTKLKQHDLANTIKSIIRFGKKGFYDGPVSMKIHNYMLENKGLITRSDFKALQKHRKSTNSWHLSWL